MANLQALSRTGGVPAHIGASNTLVVPAVDAFAAGAFYVGAQDDASAGNATSVVVGAAGVPVTVPNNLTVAGNLTVQSDTSAFTADVTFGSGDGDIITLGDTYVSATDTVNIGSAHASGDTTVNLRVDMGVGVGKSISFDSTADSDAFLLLPDTADAPTAGAAVGMIRVNAVGALQWCSSTGPTVWDTAGTSTGNSLDQAYDAGSAIDVNAADVTWTTAGAYSHIFNLAGTTGTIDGFMINNGADAVTFLYAAAGQIDANMTVETFDIGTNTFDLVATGAIDIDGVGVAIDGGAGAIGIGANAGTGAISVGTTGIRTIDIGSAAVTALTLAADAVDVNADAAITLDAAAASNFTTSAGALTLDGATGVTIEGNAGAVDIDGGAGTWDATTLALVATSTMDLDAAGALSLNSSGGVINIGDNVIAQNMNIGTGGVRTIAIGNATGATAIDIDAGTGGIAVDSGDAISLGAAASSDFTVAGTLTLQATGLGGDFAIAGAAASSITTSGGALTITGSSASTWSTSGGNLTLDGGADLVLTATTHVHLVGQAGNITFDDVYRPGSWAGVMQFSGAASDWSDFETNYGGEVSLLNALNQAANTSPANDGFTALVDVAVTINQAIGVSHANDNRVCQADANSAYLQCVGFAEAAQGTVDQPVRVLTSGELTGITIPSGTAWTRGAPVYLDDSVVGGVAITAPITGGDLVQQVGYASNTGNSSATELDFFIQLTLPTEA